SALHDHEVPMIRSLGFEVYTPKTIPTKGFRSGAVAFADDESSTLPRWVLERLNRHNFYEDPLPEDLIPLLNSYFGTVILSSYGMMVREMVRHFRGRILVRAFGREHPGTYHGYWDGFGGQELWNRVTEIGHRFRLAPPYESIAPFEPEPLRSLSVTLPLGIADRSMRNGGAWTGTCEKVLFVCPSINDIPLYYGKIYRDFKYHFGDLPHLIAGSQKKPVDDPFVLGYLPEVPYRRLLDRLRVMYYHSREPRHLHYHPLEAIVQGMPVVYLTGGLMEEFGGPDQPGACETEADARRKLRRILDGDRDLIEAIRAKQGKILETFADAYVRREWEEKFLGGVMATPLTPGTRPPAVWIGRQPPQPPRAAELPRPRCENLRIGVYLRTVPGGGVFNYATTLVRKLAETERAGCRLELFLGRRTTAVPFPAWPFGRHPRLRVHHLGDREYLPGVPFPRKQPSRVTLPDSPDLAPRPAAAAERPAGIDGLTFRRRVKLRLKQGVEHLRRARTDARFGAVRGTAAVLLAALYYGRGAVAQRTLRPQGTGATLVLRHATDPEPAPLTYEQVREVAARNDVTFFAYPYDSVAADTPLDEVEELPVVVVMYDLAHEFSLSWGQRNYTIHREMHVWAKMARMIVFGSDHIRREAVRRYGIPVEKTTVVTVPPLVPRQDPPTAEEVAAVTRKLGLPRDYVLNLGYQGPHKNNVVLLEAIRLLKWRGGRVPPLVLAGPDARRFVLGNLGDAYSVKVREVIRQAGLVEGRDFFVLDYVEPDDVPGLYGGAAACVSMSRSEAQIHGMILEAMLYKRPLVCSDLPCNVEQLGTDDEYALITPADDPAALADSLTHLLAHPEETRRRVERAHAWIKAMSWEPVLEEYRRTFAVAAGRAEEMSAGEERSAA
ncbi:MAG TPA: glycosyltransferase, partial [Planctomycetaceae bacterium]